MAASAGASPLGSTNDELAKHDEVYTQHLAIVNDIQGVIASENICNAQGQLLVSKGTNIDAKTSERILKFKLLKPIEDSISIENQITGATLFEALGKHFHSDRSLQQLWQQSAHQLVMDEFCARACEYNLIAQKLTVLQLRYPAIFEQALFCAWFCSHLRFAKSYTKDAAYEGFLAGICHDVGMLHISPDVINNERQLTDAEWRQVHSHPIIGHRILTSIKNFPKSVSDAVLEHHENLDGTGYPRHRVASQLGELGKLLNLSDSINAIYRKHLKPRARSLHDIVPIIQMNLDSRFDRTANKAIVMLRQLQGSPSTQELHQDMQAFIAKLEDFKLYIETFVDTTQHYNKAIGYNHQDPRLTALQNTLIHISMALVQSGVIDEVSLKWLSHVKQEALSHAFGEVEQSFLMIREVFFHIERFKSHLQWYIDGVKCTKVKAQLKEMGDHLALIPSLDLSAYTGWGGYGQEAS